MTTTKEFDAILDAIDWDAPSAADSNPALYEFITQMAEMIQDPQRWRQFTSAFREYDNAANAAATLSNNNLPVRPKQVAICPIRARSA